MKFIRVVFLLIMPMLILLSACAPATPTASISCVQTGCAYPAVCDTNSGQCVINNSSQTLSTVAPVLPGAGQINNNPPPNIQVVPTSTETASPMPPAVKSPGGVGPIAVNPSNVPDIPQLAACNPPPSSISNINSFCANQGAGLGGASFISSFASTPGAGQDWIYDQPKNASCTIKGNKWVCSGPSDTQAQLLVCRSCGSLNWSGGMVCATGFVLASDGSCKTADPSQALSVCPAGSHFDNALQNCVDDATNQLASPCPSDHPYYVPYGMCFAHPQDAAFNCQTFNIPLGACVQQVKQVCQPPAGGCGVDPLSGGKLNWDEATCSCK